MVIGAFLLVKLPKKNIIKETFFKEDEIEYDYTDGEEALDTLEHFGLCANENFVVREDAEVRRTPNIAKYNTLYKLRFGTKVYTKNIDKENINDIDVDESLVNRETKNGFVAIYSVKPITLSEKPVGYMAVEDIIEKSEFKNFKPKPEKSPPLVLPSDIQAVIESNLTIDGVAYQFIQDEERYNNSLSYGDYNDDGTTDFAIVLDNADQSESILLLYVLQPNRDKYNLMYKKVHSPLMKIKTVLKDTKISVNFEVTSFPIDGIYITNNEPATYFQIYNAVDKSFMVFKN